MDETESECLLSKNFTITQKQFNHIVNINSNQSLALRTIIDRDISNSKKTSKNIILDKIITKLSFGFIFILISYLMDKTLQIVCIAFGTFLIIYSITGGAISAVQLQKKN